MLTFVRVVMLVTGRIALMVKIGVRASSSAGWVGSEQFTRMAPHRPGEKI